MYGFERVVRWVSVCENENVVTSVQSAGDLFLWFSWAEDFGRTRQGRFRLFTQPFRYNSNPHARLSPTPDPSLSQLPGPHLGLMSIWMFVLLLEGKANFRGTGTITAPSPDAIKQAPADLKERLDAIDTVDLSYYHNIQGRWTCLLNLECIH